MACFVEGIEPASLALSTRDILKAESIIADLTRESETDGYYRCIEMLSEEKDGEAI
jgi:hypothetical protein